MTTCLPNYCQHFQYLKISESISVEKDPSCKYCLHSSQLWMCLSKNCSVSVCSKNSMEHLASHLEQSRKHKKFHSIFINPATTEIRCIQCHIQIGDLDIPSNSHIKNKQDPFHFRLKFLPALQELITHRIVGQLQNSEGHKKISKGLVGLFGSKYNYSINAAVQFIYHCKFIKEVLMQIKISKNNKILIALRELMEEIEKADFRAVLSDNVAELLFKEFPYLLGYKRKDPFEIILFLLSLINDQTLFHSLAEPHQYQDIDEWDLFYRKNAMMTNHLIYSAIESTLSLNYHCQKCNRYLSVPHNIQFLKLNIPKKKRRAKQIEKELASHRYDSPVKNRRKSLMNLFKEEQCPLTIPQLIIELMKSSIHKEYKYQQSRMNCECGEPLTKKRLHFMRLPDILVVQIARMSKDGSNIDQTPVELSTASLDLGPFTNKPEEEVIYDFQSAICTQKGCLFPIVVMGQFNHQTYIIRNEIVQFSKQKMNPYLLCYRRRPSQSAKQKLTEIQDDLNSEHKKSYILPDFWLLQLQNGIERPFKNQLVCKHNYLKPNVESKMTNPVKVSSYVYEDLHHFYQVQVIEQLSIRNSASSEESPNLRQRLTGHLSPRLRIYEDQLCELCSEQVEQLNVRRTKQRQFVLMYDRLKGMHLPYCMISASWIKKWSNFLYNKQNYAYMSKGYPLPLSIDNKCLLEGNKCRNNLVRNEDFKILNIYLWKFLKELYGGGPEIRYKWKEGRENLDQEMIADIKYKVSQLKMIYCGGYLESPKKLMNSLSFIDRSSLSILEEGEESPSRHPHMIIEQMEELELQESEKR